MNQTDSVQEGHDTHHVDMNTWSVSNNTYDAQDTAPRFSRRIWKAPVRFKINALICAKDMDEPTTSKELASNEKLA